MHAYHWVREGWTGRAWHLHDHDLRVATLQRQGGALSRSYDLMVGKETWTVRTSGMWRKRVHLTRSGLAKPIEARVRTTGAEIDGQPGGWLDWRVVNVWHHHYELRAKGRGVVATMKGGRGGYVAEADPTLPDAIPLLALGLVVHFLVLDRQVTTGAVAAGIASALTGG
ncbi:MAG: hypothetical protein QOJ26_1383 [Thermoplasmata archaeon]|nr:hypothetical protein [Thermoplasmata archaeon]